MKKAKNAEGDGKMSNKTPGTAVAHSNVTPNKNITWQRTTTTPTWQRTTTTPTPTKKSWDNNTGKGKPGNNVNGNGKKPWGNPAGKGKKPWGNPAGNGKNSWGTPAGNDGASTNTNKRKATGYKSGGKRGGKPTAANN